MVLCWVVLGFERTGPLVGWHPRKVTRVLHALAPSTSMLSSSSIGYNCRLVWLCIPLPRWCPSTLKLKGLGASPPCTGKGELSLRLSRTKEGGLLTTPSSKPIIVVSTVESTVAADHRILPLLSWHYKKTLFFLMSKLDIRNVLRCPRRYFDV